MNKNTGKILALSVMVMFVFMFAAPFVMAQGADPAPTSTKGLIPTIWSAFFGGMGGDGSFGDMIQEKFGVMGAGEAGYPQLIAFFLLIFIVGLLVYDIADLLPFFSKPWMKTSFAIAFSVLAFMFFDIRQIQYLTSTYQAAGLAMVAIIPFIVIAAFVWKLDKKAQDGVNPSYSMFGSAIWVGFGLYLLLKLSKLNETIVPSSLKDSPIYMAYLVLTLFALGAVFMHSKVYAWFHKKGKLAVHKLGVDAGLEQAAGRTRERINELTKELTLPENIAKPDKRREIRAKIVELKKSLSV